MVAEGLVEDVVTWLQEPTGRAVVAVALLVVGWYVSRLVIRLLGRRVARRFQRPSITRTVLRSVRVGIVVVAALAALVVVGFPITSIALSVTVFSAVLGLVLAPIVGSVINGLFVLADQPYEIGDMIELVDTGQRGFVEDMTLRYTKIFTLQNTFLVIPNSNMRDRDVLNYSAEDERTRRTLSLLVTYEGDLAAAREVMEAAARDVEEVIGEGPAIRVGSARYPAAPRCYVAEFADHGVLLELRYWVRDPYYLPRVESKVNERVWDALDDVDVTIAYPHSHLVFDETSGVAEVSLHQGRGAVDGRATSQPGRRPGGEGAGPGGEGDGPGGKGAGPNRPGEE